MARPIERIEQDIVELEKAIGFIAEQLQNAYSSYLEVLAQALGQQLILASYHLCTQGYPENFLKLSLNQRQKLQEAMRKLAKSAAQDMQTLMNDDDDDETEETEDLVEEETEEETEEELEIENDLEHEKLDFEDDDFEEIVENLEMEDEEDPNTFSENTSQGSLPLDAKIAFLSAKKGQPPIFLSEPDLDKNWKKWFNPNTSNPMELAAWQKNLERAISYTIKILSRDGNRLLQKAGILAKKLPPQVLEAAVASSEASSDVMPGPPNLLNLVVGIQSEEQEEPENLTQVMALNLRLVEIEFADIKLSSERKQIRSILNQLNKLGRDYQKKQREHSVAAAEAAWRSSWYED
ncbi:MAG: hypothetical protein WBF90_33390 [Rivularia sp. (in: cyanobacteria)]